MEIACYTQPRWVSFTDLSDETPVLCWFHTLLTFIKRAPLLAEALIAFYNVALHTHLAFVAHLGGLILKINNASANVQALFHVL